MMIGDCRLCQQSAELINSHIIPKFTLRGVRRESGKALIIKANNEMIKRENLQDPYHEHLLCRNCEDKLQVWESYVAAKIKIDKVFDLDPKAMATGLARIANLDYSKFKLFCISVLWRMSIAKGEWFKHFRLPASKEHRLRDMILASDPGSWYQFPCMLMIPYITPGITTTSLRTTIHLDPHFTKVPGLLMVTVIIDGIMFAFPINEKHRSVRRHQLAPLYLQEDGSWIVATGHFAETPFLRNAIRKITGQSE